MAQGPAHRLILIRHGETEWSKTGKHTGTTDVELTEVGREQAEQLRKPLAALTLDDPLVLSSPMQRAQQTADIAGLTIDRIDQDLREWNYGDYEGMTSAEIHLHDPAWTVFTAGGPGGESPQQMTVRMDRVCAALDAELDARDVIVLGHGHLCRSLIARWISAPITLGEHFVMLPASIAILIDDGAQRRLHTLGLTGYDNANYVDAGRPSRA